MSDKHHPEHPTPKPVPADATEPVADTELVSETDRLKAQLQEAQEKILRMQADFDNFRKRLMRDKEDAARYANASLLESLLPIIDNFELGLQATETSSDTKTIRMGFQMVKTQIERFLAEVGVKEVAAEGAMFDPHQHDAVSQQESPDEPEGKILAVRRKGYRLNDRLLRPASVVVAHSAAHAADAAKS